MRLIVLSALALVAATLVQCTPSVTLTVTQPGTPFLKTATVTVSWSLSGGSFDAANDFVSVWWEPFAGTYTEYANVTSNFGQTQFTLLNARHSFIFRYYRDSQMLAQADTVITCEGSYPMQIHAQFVPQEVDHVQLMWNTNRTNGNEVIYYGTSPNMLTQQTMAQTHRTYTQAEMNNKVGLPFIPPLNEAFPNLGCRCLRCVWGTCYNDTTASWLFVDPGVFHIAEVSGLQPGTKYYFQVGESNGYLSEVKMFKSRKPAKKDSSVQVVYTADAGVGYAYGPYGGSASHNSIPLKYGDAEGGRHVWDAILRDPETVNDDSSIMNGDISYARGWPWTWELFAKETEDIFTPAPVMTTYGNHEFDYGKNPFTPCQNGDSGGEAGIPTGVRYNFPSMEEPWFHMAQGPVHFFGLSSEQSVQKQAVWLETNLKAVDRSVTPWVIVFFHRPIHTSSTWVDKSILALMEEYYTPMFSNYGVDMVLTGHMHYYERTCPVSNNACQNSFRPIWKKYASTTMAPNQCTTVEPARFGATIQACMQACESKTDCNGAFLDTDKQCNLVNCPHPLPTAPGSGQTLYSLTRAAGRPPIYIVDGTAGGSHVPRSSPADPITEYKDFKKWGYSRIKANGTSLHWRHYHIDGSLVDEVTLQPWNV